MQWNVNPGAFELGRRYASPVDEALFSAIQGEAASYGLSLLHETGICDVDSWFSAYTACDQAYLLHFYRTGEKRDFRSFWRRDARLVQPKAVPSFTPARRAFRMDGVVI